MDEKDGTYDSEAAKNISLSGVLKIFGDLDVVKVYVKKLAPNDNSKNQPYFGGHLTELPFIPTGDIESSASSSLKTQDPKRKIKYQASLAFNWVDPVGAVYPAPDAKLIYYPQYPEVRFSGFLRGSAVKASRWMSPDKQGRSEGRWLILGVSKNKNIYAYLVTPESHLSNELLNTALIKISSVFGEVDLNSTVSIISTREKLVNKLMSIHELGWISSRKLNADLSWSPYTAQNGGGYTLEALLDIVPNGFSEPDYLGWEVKQFGVSRFPSVGAKPTTLMTPEPNGGLYVERGAIEFVRNYGYRDKSGKVDRFNFGGKHAINKKHNLTGLTLNLIGFDSEKSIITDADGAVILSDGSDNIAASWSFAKLMDHWKRKHSQAVYVPSMSRKNIDLGVVEYCYGNRLELGEGTTFELILSAMQLGSVFYDPGIKLENASSQRPAIKRRSQFRVNHKELPNLYKKYEII